MFTAVSNLCRYRSFLQARVTLCFVFLELQEGFLKPSS